jgi:hypothetical protein
MEAETLAAGAACAAAGLSLVSIGYQAYNARRSENQKWLRETLPDAILEYGRLAHEMQRLWFFCADDIRKLAIDERDRRSLELFADAMRCLDRLELVASPELIVAARNVTYAIDSGRMYQLSTINTPDYSLDVERDLYWAYAEASHQYVTLARRALGLSASPVPPGLERWRHESGPSKGD